MGRKTNQKPYNKFLISLVRTGKYLLGPNWKVFAFGFFRTDVAPSSLNLHENLRQTISRTDQTSLSVNKYLHKHRSLINQLCFTFADTAASCIAVQWIVGLLPEAYFCILLDNVVSGSVRIFKDLVLRTTASDENTRSVCRDVVTNIRQFCKLRSKPLEPGQHQSMYV